ncbi:hypothetical protein D0Z07_8695 [Hyphodiscus hymeniophilus]|uniref:gamma-glutamylcyclotransferase n=1 Tax=Hyphodiscus hymeniophilus TaxID=353542 RepID=A0A9P6VDR2_9HELO|nr:hypothetical protein D0Z07_8695 [Hyphodiscus hymeniophilus]
MSFLNSRPQAPTAQPQSLYFAYGSNLQLKQMAKRCPDSQYQGRARLHNFRWQINDRGFANVIPDPNSSVEGLCYLLSGEDEARLDRSEGVPTAYQKKWTEVDFYPGAAKLLGRKVTEILRFDLMERRARQPMSTGNTRGPHTQAENMASLYRAQEQVQAAQGREVTEMTYFQEGGRTLAMEQTTIPRRRGQSVPARNRHQVEAPHLLPNLAGGPHGEPAKVLVYLSQNHVKEGLPWDEYVERMNWGIIDAVDLGISRQYFESAIAPYLQRVTGFHANGEPRGRGIREKKKRSRHVTLKKQRRSENDAGPDQYGEQAINIQAEPMSWETTQDTQYHEYHGS